MEVSDFKSRDIKGAVSWQSGSFGFEFCQLLALNRYGT